MTNPIARGAAAFGAGLGPAGHDPADEPEERVVQEPIEAMHFDPFNRVFTQNADLTMVAGSGPIQRAALLLLPLGSLPATASNGLNIARIKRASRSQRARVILDELKIAWKSLLETQQIEILGVEIDEPAEGQSWSGLFYPSVRDLATQEKKKLTGKA